MMTDDGVSGWYQPVYVCSHCSVDTAGNHEWHCPNHPNNCKLEHEAEYYKIQQDEKVLQKMQQVSDKLRQIYQKLEQLFKNEKMHQSVHLNAQANKNADYLREITDGPHVELPVECAKCDNWYCMICEKGCPKCQDPHVKAVPFLFNIEKDWEPPKDPLLDPPDPWCAGFN